MQDVRILTDLSDFKMTSVALNHIAEELLLLIFVETGGKFKLGASVTHIGDPLAILSTAV